MINNMITHKYIYNDKQDNLIKVSIINGRRSNLYAFVNRISGSTNEQN